MTLRVRVGASFLAAALLLLPSSALAATFKVDPAHSGACSNGECATIAEAIAAAADGDVIEVAEGTYAESFIVGKVVEIRGAGDKTKVVGSGTADVVSVTAPGAAVRNMSIQAPSDGQSALVLGAASSVGSGLFLGRQGGTEPVVDATGSGTVRLERSFVVQGSITGTVGIRSAAGGLELVDVLGLSYKGPIVQVNAGVNNLFQRSTLVAVDKDANGVEVISAPSSAAKKKLVADSTVMVGGTEKSGLFAQTQKISPQPSSTAGSIDLVMRHVTILGGKGIWAQADANHLASDTERGDVKAQVASSIVHGHSRAINSIGVPIDSPPPLNDVLIADTTATIAFTSSYAPDSTDAGVTGDGQTFGTEAPYSMLRPGSFALRSDAPLIDQGGAVESSESSTDVEGQPRSYDGNGDGVAATDIGADEFNNQAPSATFGATNRNPKQNEAVGFIAFASRDPEAAVGGGIVDFQWDFGDGTRKSGAQLAAVGHSYPNKGTYHVRLTTVDKHGARTVSDPVTVVVRDGTAPRVAIAFPISGATYKLTAKSTKNRRASYLGIFGTVSDDEQVHSVQYALVLTRRAVAKKGAKAPAGQCEHFNGKALVKGQCGRVVWLPAAMTPAANGWYAATPRRLKLPAGRYQVLARAFDAAGNATGKPKKADKTLASFRVK